MVALGGRLFRDRLGRSASVLEPLRHRLVVRRAIPGVDSGRRVALVDSEQLVFELRLVQETKTLRTGGGV